MSNIVRVEEQALLDATNGTTTYTNPTTPMKGAINTSTTAPTTTAAGSEFTGGSYARATVAYGAGSAADPSVATNSGAQTYTNMPAGTAHSYDEFDSAGTPKRRWFGLLTADKTLNAGDTLTIAGGSLSKSLG